MAAKLCTQPFPGVAFGVSQSLVAKYQRGFRQLEVVDFLWIARTLEVDPKRIIRWIEKTLDAAGRRNGRFCLSLPRTDLRSPE
jgi:hypothetical protein